MSTEGGCALYEGTIAHRRQAPVAHGFVRPVQMVFVDLDALPGAFDGLPLWSARRPAPVWLRRADYGDGGRRPLADVVRDIAAEQLGRRPDGPVAMLTHPRTMGYVINPLTVYFCGDAGSDGETIILEVTNTPWKERHWYVLPGPVARGGAPFAKQLHVSPFLALAGGYRLAVEGPGHRLALRLDLVQDGARVFSAMLSLRRRTLTPRTAIGTLLDHPLATVGIWGGIHRHALALWRRGVPYVPHPGPPSRPVS